jgi:uncharacterized protein (TIGR03083 family)
MMVAMKDTSTAVESIPALGHEEAMRLAQTEATRMVELLRQLQPDEWSLQTVCELWDIRAMAGHLLGMAEFQGSIRQFAHDFISAKRIGGSVIDGINATQVRERSHLTPAQVVDGLASASPRAVRARRRTPALMRNLIKMRQDPPFQTERWRYGYLIDTIFTRDSWIHRLDISRATSREMLLTTEHDGRIVTLIVAEWARRHGRAFELALIGPAGGRFNRGTGGESIEIDVLDFCDTVAGRRPGAGLLSTRVPF